MAYCITSQSIGTAGTNCQASSDATVSKVFSLACRSACSFGMSSIFVVSAVSLRSMQIWSARHQLTVVTAKSRVAILTQIFHAVRKAKFKAVITTWACLCKNSSFKIRRACAYWSQFWQGFRQHKILMVLPRLWCWHSAVVADRLASANQVTRSLLRQHDLMLFAVLR